MYVFFIFFPITATFLFSVKSFLSKKLSGESVDDIELNLHELIELKSALVEKKNRLKETKQNDKSMSALLNADSVETIDTILDKIDASLKELKK